MMDKVTKQMQANLTMFSADLAMNLQVMTFINTLTLVEYETRAFKGADNQLGNMNILSAANGFFKLVTDYDAIWTLKWTVDFGKTPNAVKIYAILEEQKSVVVNAPSIVDLDGKEQISQAIDFNLELEITGGDDARNLAQQVMTWVLVKLGIIKEN